MSVPEYEAIVRHDALSGLSVV
ncbi:MAG: hypothetical protein JWL82_273, partial [Parcubacteria group bacterium]|nr:hypothetical protein [Parcubacteria group bacterium]